LVVDPPLTPIGWASLLACNITSLLLSK
jgi:hypothetical protein